MNLTTTLLDWFYGGFGGIGGWVVIAGGGLLAAMWLLSDSARRALPVRFERAKVICAQLLSLPAAFVRLTAAGGAPFQRGPISHEISLYLGLLGGLTSVSVAAYYLVAYHDKVACRHGHPPYPGEMGRCPHCALQDMVTAHGEAQPFARPHTTRMHATIKDVTIAHAPAWLVAEHGQRYLLFEGENSIGRSREMQFQIAGDQAVSRCHARIVARDGQFFLMDCDSTNGTRLNGRALVPYAEEPLESGDVIALSEHTHLTFVVQG